MVTGKKQGAALISDKISHYTGWLLIALPLLLLTGPAVSDVAIILIGLLFLGHAAATRQWAWTKETWVKLVAVIYLYIIIRSCLTEFSEESLGRSVPWIRFPLLAMAVAFWLYALPHVKRYLPWTLLAAVTFLAADMAFQYVMGFDIIGRTGIVSDGGSVRLTGPYTAPRAGITLAWICWPAISYLFARATNGRQIFTAGLLWIACVVVVFLSGERMATLLMILGSILLLLLIKQTRRAVLWIAPSGILILGVLIWLNPALTVRQVDSTVVASRDATSSPYGRLWVSSAKIIEDYPFFGIGAKQFRNVCKQEAYGGQKEILNCNLHPHHLYLEWWVEQGLVGLLLFVSLIIVWTKESWRYWRANKEDMVFVGLAIACIVKLLPFSTAVSFFVNWSVLPFWLMLGWMIAKTQKR